MTKIKDRKWSLFIVEMVRLLKPKFTNSFVASDRAMLFKENDYKDKGYKVTYIVTFKSCETRNAYSRTVVFDAIRRDGEGEDAHMATLYNFSYNITDEDLARLGKKSFLELKANFEYTAAEMFVAAHIQGN